MIHITKPAAAAILLAIFAGRVLGAPTVEVVSVDNTSALTGYLTHDLQATAFDSDWTGAVFLLNLSSGSIYQDTYGTSLPPSPVWFEYFPSLEFDTYVGVSGSSIAGGAGDLGGGGLAFSTTELDVSFYNIDSGDTGTFSFGRITLSDDAAGSWELLTTTEDKHLFTLSGSIADGHMGVETETIQVPTLTSMSIVSAVDGKTLITKTVTDSVRALAGNGMFGEATYEASVRVILVDMLLDELQQQQSVEPAEPFDYGNLTPLAPGTTSSRSNSMEFRGHYEKHTYTKAEYIQAIAAVEAGLANPTLPEPGTMAVLGLGGLTLLRRR